MPRDMTDKDRPNLVYLPNSTLLGILVTVLSLFLAIQSLITRKGLGRWLLFFGVTVLASIFLSTIGKRAARGKWPLQPGQHIALSGWQIVWVLILLVAGGALFYWQSYH